MICITKKSDTLEYGVLKSNHMSTTLVANWICRDCLIKIGSQGLVDDFIKLPFKKFDIILDVEWLWTYRAIIYLF